MDYERALQHADAMISLCAGVDKLATHLKFLIANKARLQDEFDLWLSLTAEQRRELEYSKLADKV